AFRWSLPCLAAVLAPNEAALFIEEDTEVRLAGLQLAAADTTAAAVGLKLVVVHHAHLGSGPILDDPANLLHPYDFTVRFAAPASGRGAVARLFCSSAPDRAGCRECAVGPRQAHRPSQPGNSV